MQTESKARRRLSEVIAATRAAGELALIASLPGHDLAFARAAVRGGAHALKVHFGLKHRASGQVSPTLRERPELIAQLRDLAPALPLGAVLGDSAGGVARDLDLARELGLDFISGYGQALPASVHACGLEVLLAFDEHTPPAWAAQLGRGTLLEASIMPHAAYGELLSAADLLRYQALRAAAASQFIVPTQKVISPADAVILRGLGVDALMYGVVVTGEQPEGFERAARAYRAAFGSAAES